MKKKSIEPSQPGERQAVLQETRNLKMARSAHAYVRGNTNRFYEWLDVKPGHDLPLGPAICSYLPCNEIAGACDPALFAQLTTQFRSPQLQLATNANSALPPYSNPFLLVCPQ